MAKNQVIKVATHLTETYISVYVLECRRLGDETFILGIYGTMDGAKEEVYRSEQTTSKYTKVSDGEIMAHCESYDYHIGKWMVGP